MIFGITIGRTTGSTDREMVFPVSNLKLHSTLSSLSSSHYISDNLFQTKPSSIISSIINTNKIKIRFVTPIFTNADYNHKFYIFYSRYARTTFGINITKDLSLLNSKITVSPNQGLPDRSQFAIILDLDVGKGYIFDSIDGSGYNSAAGTTANLYDILILGPQEYVNQKEYDNLKQFVFNGGTMILLDGNMFYKEVKYFENNSTISLVKGHGWAYNGKTAWRSIDEDGKIK